MGHQRVVHPTEDPEAGTSSTDEQTIATHIGTFAHTQPQHVGAHCSGNTVAFLFDALADDRVAETSRSGKNDASAVDATEGQSVLGAETNGTSLPTACGTSRDREIAAQQRAWHPPSPGYNDTEGEGNGQQGGGSGSALAWGLSSCSERASEAELGQELDEREQAERLRALQLHGLAPMRASETQRRSIDASPANGCSAAVDRSQPSDKEPGQATSSSRTGSPASRRDADSHRNISNLCSSKLGLRSSSTGLRSSYASSALRSSLTSRRGSGSSLRSSLERRCSAGARRGSGDEVLLQTFFSSLLAQRASASRVTIDPDANWLKMWGLVQVLCVFYNFFVVLWRMAFRSGAQFMPEPRMTWSPACAIDWICDLLLCMHILLHLVLGFVDSSNNKVLDRKRITRAYVRSRSFWVHVVALCPLDVVQLVLGQWVPMCRLNKLVRVLEMRGLLKHILDAYRVRVHFQRLLWHVILTMLLSHAIACVYFMFGSLFHGFSYTSWSPPLEILNETSAMQYFDSVYWSLGLMTGLGDGEIPVTLIESLFTLSVMMTGMFLFATIIGNVSTMVDELNENEGVLQTKLLLMTRMMRQYQLPHALEDRVTNYISYQNKNHHGFDEFQMLQTLPAGLRTDIMLQLTRSMIERVPFFHGEDEGFVRSLVDRLKPQIASAGETLVCAGQIQTEMYFVQRGELDILFGSPPVIVAKLRQGNYFGEALLSAKPCASTFQARTFCDLFTLTRLALIEVLTYYPETAKKMHELVAKRLEEDRTKEREAKLMNKYGQKCLQLLRKRQDREARASPKLFRKPVLSRGASTSSLTPQSSPSKSFRKRIHPSPPHSLHPSPPHSHSSRGQVKPAEGDAVDLGTLINSATDDDHDVERRTISQYCQPHGLSFYMTKQAAASYKVRMLMDEIGDSVGETEESFDKSTQSQGTLRSRTPWLARAIGLARARSREDYCLVVLPYGLVRQLWLLLMLFATTWNLFAVPYSISFIWGYYKLTHGPSLIPFSVYAPVLFVDIVADLIFVADLLLSQRLVFVDAQGVLEKDARVIRRRFFQTGLPRALAAAIAFDILVLALFDWCPILRLNRLVNFDKVFSLPLDVLQTFQRSTKTSPEHTSLRIFRLLFSFLAISHYIACLSTLVAADGTPLSSISYALKGSSEYPHGVVIDSAFALYLRAFYFAVSNLTGLGHDVKPVTVAEYLLTCGVWCLGIFVFAYTIGTAGVLISNSDAGETRFNKKRASVLRYIAHQKLPTELRTRAFNFFEYKWARTKGVEIQEVVNDLNSALSTDVMSHICRDAVRNVPVFALKGDQFISSIVQVLSFHAFPQGEWLMRKGTIGSEMFFIMKGQVDIIVDEQLMFVIKTLQVGDFVGEGALFQGKGKRGAACCARTSCETMVLSKDGFSHVLQLYPDIEQELLDASKKRQEDTQLVVNALERRMQRDPQIERSAREGSPMRARRRNSCAIISSCFSGTSPSTRRLSEDARMRVAEASRNSSPAGRQGQQAAVY